MNYLIDIKFKGPYCNNSSNNIFIFYFILDHQLDDLSNYVGRELYMMNIDNRSTNDLCNQSVKSMPDLYASEEIMSIARPNSTDLILEELIPVTPLYLTMAIIKGSMGFGFTIADSANGQKVRIKYLLKILFHCNIMYINYY